MRILTAWFTGASMLVLTLAVGCGETDGAAAKPTVFGAFATSVTEPWSSAVHTALLAAQHAGQIAYDWQDHLGYTGDMEALLREVAAQRPPTIFFGDAYGNEETIRRVAADYQHIAFVFGSGLGPGDPNFSVFDDWLHEATYLCGLLAGGLSASGRIGVVAGYPVPEVNRLVNAFIAGATEVTPGVQVTVAFINQWYDPGAARAAAQAQITAGADVIFAEREGAADAATAPGLWAFGNITDHRAIAPDHVVTSAVWNMTPTVQHVLRQIRDGSYAAQDLQELSTFADGGAALAPLGDVQSALPAEVLQLVHDREQQITAGLFRVAIAEGPPRTER